MLERLLPSVVDNRYRGQKLALWIFVPLLVMRLAIGANSMLNARTVAQGADGIPVDTFSPEGAQAFLAMFAAFGLAQLFIALFGVLVLIRYRAFIPFMFAVFLLEHISRRILLQQFPIPRTGSSPGGMINLILFGLEIAGLALALWRRRNVEPTSAGTSGASPSSPPSPR